MANKHSTTSAAAAVVPPPSKLAPFAHAVPTVPAAIAPEFVSTLQSRAANTIFLWLKHNAPVEVRDVFEAMQELTSYSSMAYASGGFVNQWMNDNLSGDHLVDIINLLSGIGVEWTDESGDATPRRDGSALAAIDKLAQE